MKTKSNSKFYKLLNSISSKLTYDILELYLSNKGLNLTETASQLNQSVSTVQDYLNKLKDTNLIYRIDNNYYLSNYGQYFLKELNNFAVFSKVSHIFGKIPVNMIPLEFINDLLPSLIDVKIENSSWHFMNGMQELLNNFKKEMMINKNFINFKVLGWWSIEYDFQLFQTMFKDFKLDLKSFQKIFDEYNFQIKLISDKIFLDELRKFKKLREVLDYLNVFENFRIYEGEIFNFSILKFNRFIGLFLVDENDIDVKNHLFFKENLEMDMFFEKIFDYYWKRSKPVRKFSKLF
ncbi:MAG: winged helix-turn-helix transcriptional regulator [Candidatus Lokiarchaeota archaeon]|nr:winged helix-turn-helix transcriptional regulator [Candidatus Lokiarchaeota archaeon]